MENNDVRSPHSRKIAILLICLLTFVIVGLGWYAAFDSAKHQEIRALEIAKENEIKKAAAAEQAKKDASEHVVYLEGERDHLNKLIDEIESLNNVALDIEWDRTMKTSDELALLFYINRLEGVTLNKIRTTDAWYFSRAPQTIRDLNAELGTINFQFFDLSIIMRRGIETQDYRTFMEGFIALSRLVQSLSETFNHIDNLIEHYHKQTTP